MRSLSLLKLARSHAARGASASRSRSLAPLRPPLRASASARSAVLDAPVESPVAPSPLLDKAEAWIRADLASLFTDAGVDDTHFENDVKFADPLASFRGVGAYKLNIAFLRRAFSPTLLTHSVLRTGPAEITTRWTMSMKAPVLTDAVFTGTSVYGLNPSTGRIASHTDTWDSVPGSGRGAAVVDLLRQACIFHAHNFRLLTLHPQVLSPLRAPDLETPEFVVLKRTPDYEIRRYEPFLEAQTSMALGSGPAGDGGGFGTLAKYIFGGNADKAAMSMTTPVLTRMRDGGSPPIMAFPLEKKMGRDPDATPRPDEAAVRRAAVPAAVRAAARFGGIASDGDATREEGVLRSALMRDGLAPSPGWQLARYNDPFTPPWARRNEVLIDLEGYSLE